MPSPHRPSLCSFPCELHLALMSRPHRPCCCATDAGAKLMQTHIEVGTLAADTQALLMYWRCRDNLDAVVP